MTEAAILSLPSLPSISPPCFLTPSFLPTNFFLKRNAVIKSPLKLSLPRSGPLKSSLIIPFGTNTAPTPPLHLLPEDDKPQQGREITSEKKRNPQVSKSVMAHSNY